jgi:hypothetical protein
MKGPWFARLLAVCLLAFLAVTPALAVQYGQPDGNAHPYVGLVVFYDTAGKATHRCTGTLLSSTVFLTAGHCTEGAASARVYFDPQVIRSPQAYPYVGGVTGTPHTYSGFDFSQLPNTGDIGVVVLDKPVVMATYGALPKAGFLDTLATKRGTQDVTFTVVGYGLQSVKPREQADLVRYRGVVELVNLRSALTDGYNLHYTNNPGQGRGGPGGTCFGDSGGPVFYDNTNIVVAVNSFVLNSNCKGAGFGYRVDTQSSLNFIRQYLKN